MLKLTDTLEVVRDARCLFRMEKKQKPRKNEFRERVGTISERTFKGESRTDTCKDRIAETQRVRESRRAEMSEVQWMCLTNLGTEMVSRCGYIIENQHEEKGMIGSS